MSNPYDKADSAFQRYIDSFSSKEEFNAGSVLARAQVRNAFQAFQASERPAEKLESKQEPTWLEYALNQVEDSVAHVILPNQARIGTCFLLKKEEYKWFLLTNYHVTGGIEQCQVRFVWSKDKFDADIVFTHKAMDLAILSIKTPPIDQTPVVEVLMFSRQISKGTPLAVVGFRQDEEPKIQPGVCTGFDSPNNRFCMTTNAIVNAGDSGAPVVGKSGELLGVAVATVPDLQEADVITTLHVEIFLGFWLEKENKKQKIEMENKKKRKIEMENKQKQKSKKLESTTNTS